MNIREICEFALESIKDDEGVYTSERLIEALGHIIRPNMNEKEIRKSLIQISLELTTEMEPKWQFVAAKLYIQNLYEDVKSKRGLLEEENVYGDLYKLVRELTDKGLYGKYIYQRI